MFLLFFIEQEVHGERDRQTERQRQSERERGGEREKRDITQIIERKEKKDKRRKI
jgi:hypothetical protein